MSHFTFLQPECPGLHDEAAGKAEALVHTDPRVACFYARRALEAAMAWLYTYDSKLKPPCQDNLSALIHEPIFKAVAGETIFTKARVIQRQTTVVLPPFGMQREFARWATVVENLKVAQRAALAALAALDSLFAALQHRAFRGEL